MGKNLPITGKGRENMAHELGVIRNKERMRQLISFRNLKFGDCAPTDVDMLMDCKGMAWVIGDLKYRGAACETGQRLCLERFVENSTAYGKPAYAIIADHYVDDPNEDVDAADAIVREIKCGYERWKAPARQITVREAIELIEKKHSIPFGKGFN